MTGAGWVTTFENRNQTLSSHFSYDFLGNIPTSYSNASAPYLKTSFLPINKTSPVS